MRRRARLGRYFTFARQSPVTFLSGTKDAFSNGDRQGVYGTTAPLAVSPRQQGRKQFGAVMHAEFGVNAPLVGDDRAS